MKKIFTFCLFAILLAACNQKKEVKPSIKKGFSSEEKTDSTHVKHLFNTALTKG